MGWGKAKQSCTFSNPKIYSFISKPTYANYYNVARWTDPNLHVRPFEMFCDPHPCIDPNLDNSTETVKLCIGEDTLRGGQQFGNMNKCTGGRASHVRRPGGVRVDVGVERL